MEVYIMLERLAYLVDTMKEVETNLRAVLEKEYKTLPGGTMKFLRDWAEYLDKVRIRLLEKRCTTVRNFNA